MSKGKSIQKKMDPLSTGTDDDRTGTSTLSGTNNSIQTKLKPMSSVREALPSPAKILLPTTIGIPDKHGDPESRRRDPRVPWAPAITIGGKTNHPFITSQYQKKEQRLAEKSEQVKLDPKVMTNADLSHLTRSGNDRTRLPISFLPHKIAPSKRPTDYQSD